MAIFFSVKEMFSSHLSYDRHRFCAFFATFTSRCKLSHGSVRFLILVVRSLTLVQETAVNPGDQGTNDSV